MSSCRCATRWERFIPMKRLLICFPHTASLLKLASRLALITIFQFMEHLTDRQEALAVRDRLAWKYTLSLELTDAGFDHTVLSEFRSRLVEGNAEQRLLDLLLERCREGGWRNRRRAATRPVRRMSWPRFALSTARCAWLRPWCMS